MEEKLKKELKELYAQLESKTDYCFDVAPLVERSGGTVMRHWFGESRLSPGLPNDKKKLLILRRELKKTIRKQERKQLKNLES